MSKASSVVASVTQQSRQRVPQSRTVGLSRENTRRPRVQMARRVDDQQRSVDDVSVARENNMTLCSRE